ncbi:MAG TPA: hypothetical protein VGL59_02620 [Polyangia bacterium]|jgi:hypothetical protein
MRSLLVTSALAILIAGAAQGREKKPKVPAAGASSPTVSSGCVAHDAAAIWWSPRDPVAGALLRLLAVSEAQADGQLQIVAPDGSRLSPAAVKRGGPPFSLAADVEKASAGMYRVSWLGDGKVVSCQTISVGNGRGRSPAAADGTNAKSQNVVWSAQRNWDRATENLYSAWIEMLFDAPPDQSVDYRPLHQVLREPAKNFLYGYLGLREDDPANKNAVPATPDCADLPYYLRAYFSWKMGLPFGSRDCDRGTDARPPRCQGFLSNEQPAPGRDTLGSVKAYLRRVMNRVQSGSARTALSDDETDYYPVKLDRASLRPGVIYADPYGHVMVIAKWIDQTDQHGGLLLAVDGQPDTSIGRKRFWEGTFLFTNDTKSAGPGFKAFRPVVRNAAGALETVPNAGLAGDAHPGAPRFSAEQGALSPDAFYARLGAIINPRGLDARAAYAETLDALVEQMQVRVGSVDNGEKFMRENKNPVVPMPEGAKIFETTGPWEDYATPSRDMRLLIALNVLASLPERIVRHPELFVLNGKKPDTVRVEIETLHRQRITERSIEYKRSDGSPWKLTVADLLARKTALEIAYNPNDCVEARWGAAEGTPEAATCQRHLPDDQRQRMNEYRVWFHEARRPPR